MRLMSFSMTIDAFLAGRKTVTRRLGWKNLKAGDRLMAVEKAQGLKRGEEVRRLGEIEVVSVRREPLNAIQEGDAAREGFPLMPEWMFVSHFREAHGLDKVHNDTEITRIEFRRIT
jgi:hypothetical protein